MQDVQWGWVKGMLHVKHAEKISTANCYLVFLIRIQSFQIVVDEFLWRKETESSVGPDKEIRCRHCRHDHEPEPDEHEDLLVKQVDGQDTLKKKKIGKNSRLSQNDIYGKVEDHEVATESFTCTV